MANAIFDFELFSTLTDQLMPKASDRAKAMMVKINGIYMLVSVHMHCSSMVEFADDHESELEALIIQCREADLRITPKTIEVYEDSDRLRIRVSVQGAPRDSVFRALYQSIRYDENPTQMGQCCLDILAACHVITESERTSKSVIFSA